MRILASAMFAGLVAGVLVSLAFALPPSDVRLVAGTMPGYPLALPQVYPQHRLTAARRRLVAQRFARIRIGSDAATATSSMGHVYKTIAYGPGKSCDYFDGKFVLCIIGSRVVAKGFQIGS